MTTSHYQTYWVISFKNNKVKSEKHYISLEKAQEAANGNYIIITDAQFGRAVINESPNNSWKNWITLKASYGTVSYPVTANQIAISNI